MKKFALAVVAFIAAAPLVVASGTAFAATTYTPVLVKQFNTEGDSDFQVRSIMPVNDSVAVVQLENDGLFLTDGTAAGTTDLEATATGDGLTDWDFYSSLWENNAVSDGVGTLYFWGYGTDDEEWNIWTFNGTAFDQLTTAGWIHPRSSMYFLGGDLYAWGRTNDSTASYFAFNQIDIGTGAVYEIAEGNECDGPQRTSAQVHLINDLVVFANDTNDNCNFELLSWNPANPATPPVNLGEAQYAAIDFADWESRAVFEGELYFSGQDVDLGYELWATDGTIAGTRLVKDIYTGPGSSGPGDDGYLWFTEFDSALYFAANDPAVDDFRLYKTDGTTEGTVRVNSDLENPGSCTDSPGVVLGDMMYTDFGCQLYVTDGDEFTQLTDNPYGQLCWDFCAYPVAFDSHVFFVYYDGTNNSVWVTDGTVNGTSEVTNFSEDLAVANNGENVLVQVGSHLLFGVSDFAENGGTDEIALYSIGQAELADTGANVDRLALAGLVAVVAGAGVYAMRRRANV